MNTSFCFVFQTSVDLDWAVDHIISANTNCVIPKYKSALCSINHNEKVKSKPSTCLNSVVKQYEIRK